MSVEPPKTEFSVVPTGSVLGFPAHEGRPGAIGEVHARPQPLIEKPRVLIQLSFMTEGGAGVDHAVLPNCRAASALPPPTGRRVTIR